MDQDIMYHKISKPIEGDPNTNIKKEAQVSNKSTDNKKGHSDTGKDHKKVIVLFKKGMELIVVIFMQVPEKAVHNVFMC